MLSVENLTFRYSRQGAPVLNGVNLALNQGCLFVMGDNRGVSKDSRYPDVGQIDKREVLGKAIFLMYPGTDDGSYPREMSRVGAIK